MATHRMDLKKTVDAAIIGIWKSSMPELVNKSDVNFISSRMTKRLYMSCTTKHSWNSHHLTSFWSFELHREDAENDLARDQASRTSKWSNKLIMLRDWLHVVGVPGRLAWSLIATPVMRAPPVGRGWFLQLWIHSILSWSWGGDAIGANVSWRFHWHCHCHCHHCHHCHLGLQLMPQRTYQWSVVDLRPRSVIHTFVIGILPLICGWSVVDLCQWSVVDLWTVDAAMIGPLSGQMSTSWMQRTWSWSLMNALMNSSNELLNEIHVHLVSQWFNWYSRIMLFKIRIISYVEWSHHDTWVMHMFCCATKLLKSDPSKLLINSDRCRKKQHQQKHNRTKISRHRQKTWCSAW